MHPLGPVFYEQRMSAVISHAHCGTKFIEPPQPGMKLTPLGVLGIAISDITIGFLSTQRFFVF